MQAWRPVTLTLDPWVLENPAEPYSAKTQDNAPRVLSASCMARSSVGMPQRRTSSFVGINVHKGSAMPRSIVDACARVWLAKCVVGIFDVIDVDCAERRLRFLQRRASLNLNKLILEITAWQCGDHLIALLRSILIISNPDDVN